MRRIACLRRWPHAFARVSRWARQVDSRKRGLHATLYLAEIACELASSRERGTDGTLLSPRDAAPTRRPLLIVDGCALDGQPCATDAAWLCTGNSDGFVARRFGRRMSQMGRYAALSIATQTGHPTAEIGGREAVIGGLSRGLGTSGASHYMNSSGDITRCVVPSRQGRPAVFDPSRAFSVMLCVRVVDDCERLALRTLAKSITPCVAHVRTFGGKVS